ncbi:MAG: thermonuclease family protein [Xanthobacteraceae bacterium]
MGRRGDAHCNRIGWLLALAVLVALPARTALPQASIMANPPASGSAQMVQAGGPGQRSACGAVPADAGQVTAVLDGRSFLLEDGREVRLAGIEVPFVPRSLESGREAEAGRAAQEALKSLIGGRQVQLRQFKEGAGDRYGRVLAHASVMIATGGETSVAHEMLARGFALVSAQVGDLACAQELWREERGGRAGKLGLWNEPYYVVRAAQRFVASDVAPGQFSLVEGKPLTIRESGGTIYMNFGRKWSEALTVTISKRNERTFTAAGLEVRRLENRLLRIRGYVEERNGPRIEASRPEQIEMADRI